MQRSRAGPYVVCALDPIHARPAQSHSSQAPMDSSQCHKATAIRPAKPSFDGLLDPGRADFLRSMTLQQGPLSHPRSGNHFLSPGGIILQGSNGNLFRACRVSGMQIGFLFALGKPLNDASIQPDAAQELLVSIFMENQGIALATRSALLSHEERGMHVNRFILNCQR